MRRSILKLISLVLFSGSSGWGVPTFSFELSDLVPPSSRQSIEDALQEAIRHVRALPPSQDNPFCSRKQRRVQVVVTMLRDPVAQQVYATSRESAAADDSDAFTFTVATREVPPELVTFIFLIADRLFWDPQTGRQRADGFVRLLSALGHEVYGNLPDQLKLIPGKPPLAATFEERRKDEMVAFEAGIAFLERYLASDLWAGFSAETRSDIEKALERDQQAFQTWKRASECTSAIQKKLKN